SVAVFPEAVHSAFLLGAVVLMSRPARVRRAAAAGALLALAYLVRVESLAIIAWTIGVLFILGWRDDAGRRRRGLVLVVVLVCFVGTLPFAFHLERVTGTWRWEGKGGRISRAIDRMQGGATFRDAHFEVDAEGRERGAFLSLEPTTGPGWRVLDFRRSGWWTHAGHGMKRLSSMALTGHTWMSLFLAITLLFAFRAGRRAGRVDLLLFGWVAAGLAAFILYRPAIRYIAPLAIPFALWSGRVLADLRGRWLGIPVAVLAALLALSTARSLVTGMSEYDESAATHASVRDVGAVLRELPGKGAVMSDDARVAYFSDRPWVPFPAAPHWEAALRWARSRGVEWIHLRRFGGQGLGPAPAELQRVSDQFESLFRLER
ncbi:MAG: hypothetical protein CMJ83_13660, partial [Planctomycetes bacterium]|nr:hypothetical protein [Planctomycetota bacterium]